MINVVFDNTHWCSVCDSELSAVSILFDNGAYGSVYGAVDCFATLSEISLCKTHFNELLKKMNEIEKEVEK